MTKKRLKSCLLRMGLFITVFSLAGGALSCSSPSSPGTVPQTENLALDFTLPTMTGTEITLSALQGMPVVLNFWATWCSPCRMELPYFDAVAKQYGDKVTIVAIGIQESTPRLEEFFGDSKVSFIVALDEDAQVASEYGIRYIPTTFFLDSQGVARYKKVGAFASEMELRASVDELLSKGG